MTSTGTQIASGYPLIDSERQSLAKRIDAEIAPLVEALKQIAAEAYVSADELIPPYKPNGWRDVAVERIDIARAAIAKQEEL